jgi:hypothetical protein
MLTTAIPRNTNAACLFVKELIGDLAVGKTPGTHT